MATEKQICANRRNALRSSGPTSAAGKKRSSQNALRHGLAVPLTSEEVSEAVQLSATIALFDRDWAASDQNTIKQAKALVALRKIRRAQVAVLEAAPALLDPASLKKLLSIERYERRALPKKSKSS